MTNIRMATTDDLSNLAGLFNSYRIFYRKVDDINAAENFLRDRMVHRESVIYVAEEAGELVGFAQLYPLFSSTRLKRSWLLNDLFVAEPHRRKGVSRLLLEASTRLASDTNAAGVLLETEKTNVPGNALYPSAGFGLYNSTNFYWWENE
jgi:GNAT superfamily N-acetyltransferase